MTNTEKAEMFKVAYKNFVEKAMATSWKARREGLLACEEDLDMNAFYEREVFNYCLKLVIDGTDASVIEELARIMMRNSTDWLAEYKLQAAMSIQAGDNPRILHMKLNALSPFNFKEDPTYDLSKKDFDL
jgi:flagellar motor component MotA